MKNKLKIIFLVLIVAITMLFGACDFSAILKPIPNLKPVEENFSVELSAELITVDESFGVAVIGQVDFDVYPERVVVGLNDKEYQIKPISIKYTGAVYLIGVQSVIVPDTVAKGEQELLVLGYVGGTRYTSSIKTTLSSDSEYSDFESNNLKEFKFELAEDDGMYYPRLFGALVSKREFKKFLISIDRKEVEVKPVETIQLETCSVYVFNDDVKFREDLYNGKYTVTMKTQTETTTEITVVGDIKINHHEGLAIWGVGVDFETKKQIEGWDFAMWSDWV